jgi:hypothetical protein
MEKKKSKEDIQFEKEMAIIKKGGRIPYTREEIKELDDMSKSGNPKTIKKTPTMENKKSKEDIQFEKEMEIIKKGGSIGGYEELDFSKSGNPLPKKSSAKKTK